jgi:hypothetical protein
MATNIRLTRLDGDEVTVDADLVDAGTADVASLSDPLVSGVSRGTRVTPSAGSTVDVVESVQLVNTIIQAAKARQDDQGLIFRDGMGAASEDFTAAAFAAIAGLSLTVPVGAGGNYLIMISGTGESTNAAASGGAVRVALNGGAIGRTLTWGVAQFINNNQAAMGLGAMGLQLEQPLVAGDVLTVEAACVPGGGADIFRVRDVSITIIRIL